tara:strand:- start:1226 stop:1552 length:327 start_codon:yes stop_codon:yes gene_type:complete
MYTPKEILFRWGAVEADFLRHYRIKNVFRIGWKRFLRLLSNLPFEDSAFFLPLLIAAREGTEFVSEEQKQNNPKSWYKQQRDKIKGRSNKERNQVSMEQFMQQMKDNR